MHSVMAPEVQAMPHHWSKHLVEQWLIESGLAHTILQPASYMQNVRGVWPSIMDGLYPVPYPTDVPFSSVDLADVAQVAAEILTVSGHEGATYELCGPEILTPAQMAARMSDALRRPVDAGEISRDQWLRDTRPDPQRAHILLKMFGYYSMHGFMGESQALAQLLCTDPTTFAEYSARTA